MRTKYRDLESLSFKLLEDCTGIYRNYIYIYIRELQLRDMKDILLERIRSAWERNEEHRNILSRKKTNIGKNCFVCTKKNAMKEKKTNLYPHILQKVI